MQKIDLHQDLISSFSVDISAFGDEVGVIGEWNTNAWWLPNYKKADLQIVRASTWPYEIVPDPNNSQKKLLRYSNRKLISDWKAYENLRKEHWVYLIQDSQSLWNTKYVDFRLNLVYHLKWMDGVKKLEDIEKLKNAWYRSFQPVWEFDNSISHCHRSAKWWLTEFGLDVIDYLDKNNLIIDTANMNYESMIASYQFTKKPIINSHTNVLSLYNHSRNVTDEFLLLVRQSEWLIWLSLTSLYITWNERPANLDDYIEQIKYVKERVWDQHVAFGSWYHSLYFKQVVRWTENISSLIDLEKRVVDEFWYKFASLFFWENAYRLLMQTI